MASERDKLLVRTVLALVEDLDLHEAGRTLGVSYERVRLWRAGEWERLNTDTRKILRQKITELEADPARFVRIPIRPPMTDPEKARAWDRLTAWIDGIMGRPPSTTPDDAEFTKLDGGPETE